MGSEFDLATRRFSNFLRDVIDPAVYPVAVPVEVGAHQIQDPRAPLLAAADAIDVAYAPVAPGWRWGPKWSTCWFRVSGSVPEAFAGRSVVLRFSSGTEALVWAAETNAETNAAGRLAPAQGFDVNRDAVTLFEPARGGEHVLLHIEAACNHPFGTLGFEWDDDEVHRRWNGDAPGRLERAELAVLDARVRELSWRYAFVLGLLKDIPQDTARSTDLLLALTRATNAIRTTQRDRLGDGAGEGGRGRGAGAGEAMDILGEAIARRAGGSATSCHVVGHAHIDTAWLWPIRETRRKVLRSWTNAAGLMDRFPDFRFLCSQTQQYAWCEEDSPELFARIKRRVEEGRWEPGGAMWVEPDVNVPSGESLVRQMLKADRWWRSRFGEHATQRHLYLPDTFGFTPVLPQLMRQAGLATFITNKLHWNQFNTFPHTTFVWRGIDGTEVLGHNTPGKDYNAVNTPKELRRGESTMAGLAKEFPGGWGGGTTGRWLQPFGYGDGGGGPTDRSVRGAQFAADCDGLARVRMTTAAEFCAALHADADAMSRRGERLPTWDGELYLELHRGTLTTHARLKAANRRAEERLKKAELLLAGSPTPDSDATAAAAPALDRAWKRLLLNQFHDILPGSSIGAVYEDANADHAALAAETDALIRSALTPWTDRLRSGPTSGDTNSAIVLNTTNAPRAGVVESSGSLRFASVVPALGAAAVRLDDSPPAGVAPARAQGLTLDNGIVRAVLNAAGEVEILECSGPGTPVRFDAARPGGAPLNQLWLYEDRPHFWEAWDIDSSYERKGVRATRVEGVRVLNSGPLRAQIEVDRRLGEASRLTQVYSLDAGARRLDVRTRVEWHESRTLLRALFPTDLRAAYATYDIQFGHVQRPTHRNTPWDAARFEVFAHRWADLSDAGGGRGLAVLNDGKYGHSCHAGTYGLSLLRSTKHPDPDADMGEHAFTYSLMPHAGDWRAAGVIDEADALNEPLAPVGSPGGGSGSWAPLVVSSRGAARAIVTAIKPAEDRPDAIVVRLHEAHGAHGVAELAWNLHVERVQPVNALERAWGQCGGVGVAGSRVAHIGRRTTVELRPFEVVTLLAVRPKIGRGPGVPSPD